MSGMEQHSCRTCDTYGLCKTYDRLPEGESGCDDWEPARLPEGIPQEASSGIK